MSTRFSTTKKYGVESLNLGYEGSSTLERLIPSCGLEDVDRAMFRLFDNDIPLIYQQKDGTTKKVPVIFATGERFAINRRKEPLRDKNGALILPIVTITRTGIEQQAPKMIEVPDAGTISIKRRISDDDPLYQRVVNSLNLEHAQVGAGNRSSSLSRPSRKTGGRLLEPNLAGGLYETITIPTPKFYTAKYEITLWTQYIQHSNSILTTIMSGYHNTRARTYRIETPSGYWFVATFESGISSDNNFDSMSDEERIIKSTLTAEVSAYIITPDLPGIPNGARRHVSATQFSFGIIEDPEIPANLPGNIQDMRSDSRILDPIVTVDDPMITGAVGSQPAGQAEFSADGTQKKGTSSTFRESTAVGGTESSSIKVTSTTRNLSVDPMTGRPMDVTVRVRNVSKTHGEEVLTTVTTTARSNKDIT